MRFGIKTLDEAEVRGKTVLCRVDINQPVDRAKGTLKSINRIQACVPTVRELSDRGAKVVLMAHQGSDIEYKNFYTTKPHAAVLQELLGREVKWIDDVCGPAAREAIRALKDGEISDVVESTYGYHIILRLPLEDLDQFRDQLVSDKMQELGDQWLADNAIQTTDAYDKIDPSDFWEKAQSLQEGAYQEIQAVMDAQNADSSAGGSAAGSQG